VSPVISSFPDGVVLIFDHLLYFQNWTGMLYQVKQEKLLGYGLGNVSACHSWCDVCSFAIASP